MVARWLVCSLLLVCPAAAWNARLPKRWSNRLGVTLTPISTGVWAAERPLRRFGVVDVGSRMVLSRAVDGSLTVHSPIALHDDLEAAVAALGGGVGHVIAPSGDLAAHTWASTFPEARILTFAEAAQPDELPSFEVITVGDAQELDPDDEPSHIVEMCRTFSAKIGLASIWPSAGPLYFFYHVNSQTLLCGDAWWNFPKDERPAGEGTPGADGTGSVHQCSKVPIDETSLPSARVPRRLRAWAALKNRVLWPARRSVTAQGGLNIGGWVLKAGGRPPGTPRALFQNQVAELLEREYETLVPSHGDVLRGKAACREALEAHFIPPNTRTSIPLPPPGSRGAAVGGKDKNYVDVRLKRAFD